MIRQALPRNLSGKTVTLAIKASNVTDSPRLSEVGAQSGHADVAIQNGVTIHTFVAGDSTEAIVWGNGSGLCIEWIALYKGEYTAETLPEYQPKGYAVELLACHVAENNGIGIIWEKIWENASPGSNMVGGTTITVPTSSFDLIAIRSRWSASMGGRNMYFGKPGDVVNTSLFATTGNAAARTITIGTDDTITFSDGHYDGNKNNGYMIPLEIYGIKGVL
jgi:hypothetical protein